LITDEGLKFLNDGKYERANASFNKAIAANPNSAKAQKYKGTILYHLEKYEEAIKYFDEALRLDPTYSEATKERVGF
jgi:tetratricopeptide (TPR) repeat protein